MSNVELDTSYTDEPMCPYCGSRQSDAWEWRDDDGERQCGECDKAFTYSRKVSVNWSTKKIAP